MVEHFVIWQAVLANGDIVKTANRARKSAAGYVLSSGESHPELITR